MAVVVRGGSSIDTAWFWVPDCRPGEGGGGPVAEVAAGEGDDEDSRSESEAVENLMCPWLAEEGAMDENGTRSRRKRAMEDSNEPKK